jgi:glycine/D-amino acid oxidase-like deaminating enzyme
MSLPDAIVIGGGIVGASCAERLSADGLRTLVLESDVAGSGATAAGMGHVVVMDENEPEFALTRYSTDLWHECRAELPPEAEFEARGTLWVAVDDEEMEGARGKAAFYTSRGIEAEILEPGELYASEPQLRRGLAGGLLVRGDAVTYPPPVARWLLRRTEERGGTLRIGARATALTDDGVTLEGGERLSAPILVLAAGAASNHLVPGLPMQPRKGHLAITDRYPGFLRHQLVELGYLKSAHGSATESVALNVQPRATGQILIGSSRQFGQTGSEINHGILSRMLQRAIEYLPGMASLDVLRTWTGFRAATPDKLPLIGRAPGFSNLWLATGHEGLGITMSLGTGQLLADLIAGREAAIDASAFCPARFASVPERELRHA